METRSRKVTYKRRRNNRRKIQAGITVTIGLLLICFLYQQQQTLKGSKPVVQSEVVVKEESPTQPADPPVPKQEKVVPKQDENSKEEKNIVTEISQVNVESPVIIPIVKENVQQEKPVPSKSVAVTGVVTFRHKVKAKQTLYSIAKIYYKDADVERILSANNISNPNLDVKEGSILKIVNPSYLGIHTVQKGETLYQVGRTHYSKSAILEYMSNVNSTSSDVKEGASVKVFAKGKLVNHTVKRKETLFGIMSQYYQLSEFLKLIQNVNQVGEEVQEGQTLLIPNPFVKSNHEPSVNNWAIEILVNNHTLTIYRDGKLYKEYSVSTGKGELTPKGTFQVITKFSNPEYTPKKIPGGDPLNPLGTRWLGLNVPGTIGRTYGIHGTSDPHSIGKSVSNGCVRLQNTDVEEIFKIIPIGTEVVIK